MKAITTQGWGLNPKLVLGDFDEPKPGPNDLLAVGAKAQGFKPGDGRVASVGISFQRPGR